MSQMQLLSDLRMRGIKLTVNGDKLLTPKWPKDFPSELKRAFRKHKRGLMTTVASPVFLTAATYPNIDARLDQFDSRVFSETEVLGYFAMVDDQLVIWLPLFSQQDADRITGRLALRHHRLEFDRVHVYTGRHLPPILRQAVKSGRSFCGYDLKSDILPDWRAKEWIGPSRWIDLRNLARAGGWPENWKNLAYAAIGCQTENAIRVPLFLNGKQNVSFHEIDVSAAFIRDKVNSLLLQADVFDVLRHHDEPELLDVHQKINKRGIGFDSVRAKELIALSKMHFSSQFEAVSLAIGSEVNPAESDVKEKLRIWLHSQGFTLPALNRETVEFHLSVAQSCGVQLPSPVTAVLLVLLAMAKHPSGSLERALELLDVDGRLHHHLSYFGSHTGEWKSRGVRFDEMTHSQVNIADLNRLIEKETVIESISQTLPSNVSFDIIHVMVPSCFVPASGRSYCLGKYHQNHSRLTAWLVSRSVEQLTANPDGDWETEVREYLCHTIREVLVSGREVSVGRCRLNATQKAVKLHLPSGRTVFYRRALPSPSSTSVNSETCPNKQTQERLPRCPVHESYAGRLVEDIVKAVGRDLLAEALIRCESEQLPVVLHVHDEIVIEVPEADAPMALTRLLKIMSTPPSWAADLSLEVSGWVCSRYARTPNEDTVVVTAHDGQINQSGTSEPK